MYEYCVYNKRLGKIISEGEHQTRSKIVYGDRDRIQTKSKNSDKVQPVKCTERYKFDEISINTPVVKI